MTRSKIILCRSAALIAVLSSVAPAQTLRELAQKRGVLIGTAHSGRTSDTEYLDLMGREFNQVEAENATKFGPIHPAEDSYNFAPVDTMVEYAAAHKMRVRGHVFVWHNQNPKWITDGGLSPEQLAAALQKHIATVGGRYRGKIFAWDVVNEAFLDNGSLRDTVWLNKPGIGLNGTKYMEKSFRWAREADPDAKLFYNDYSAEGVNAKSDAIYEMAKDFKKRGVPIDGIGLQAHLRLSAAGNLASIEANIKRITELGLQVHITELDVRIPVDASGKASESDIEAQAKLYGAVASICLKYPLCTSIQTWGFTDKYSWIPRTYPGFGAALLLDRAFQPKPAYKALLDALAATK